MVVASGIVRFMSPAVLPLFERWPALQGPIAHLPLCSLPTPVENATRFATSLGLDSLYIKRDDLSAPLYGGNKIRKLEFLLAEAQRRGHRQVLTFGYAGSNFAAATALYAQQLGMHGISMLLPQPNAAYVRENLLLGLAANADLHQAPNEALLAIKTLWVSARHALRGARPYWIPAGGSNWLGVLGYINAAVELQQQIDAGLCPRPGVIYLPMGSMGCTAGLAIGLRACGLDIPIQAVRVVPTRYGSAQRLERLIRSTTQKLRRLVPAFPDTSQAIGLCRVRDEFFGSGYGAFTAAALDAIQRARDEAGLALDGTYSGKAMAALLADMRDNHKAQGIPLFWNTHNSSDTRALTAGQDYRRLPASLQRYFTEALQDG